MNILFLSHYFPPEVTPGANRTYEHAVRWVREKDVKVTVITNHPHHPHGVLYPGYSNQWFTHEQKDGLDLYRVKTFLSPSSGFARRTANYLAYMLAATAMATRLPRPDLVIATSPQFLCAAAGYLVSRIKGCPFVFELRDIWPDSIVSVGAMAPGLSIRLLAKLELALYRKAHLIVALTEAFRDYLLGKGIPGDKIQVVKNGVDLRFFQPRPVPEDLKMALGGQGKFIVSYIGTLGMAHALNKVVKVAQRLQPNPHILFLIVGEGAEKPQIQQMVADLRLTNIKVLPGVTKDEVRNYYAVSDLNLVTLKKTPLFQKVLPSKIFEIMAMARPVLCAVDGECRRIIEEAGSGVFVEPENVGAMAAVIQELALRKGALEAMGRNGRQFVENYFDRNRLAHQCLEILRDTARQHHLAS